MAGAALSDGEGEAAGEAALGDDALGAASPACDSDADGLFCPPQAASKKENARRIAR